MSRKYKKRIDSLIVELVAELYELTEAIWQLGAIIAGVLVLVTIGLLFWVDSHLNMVIEGNTYMKHLGVIMYALYLLPMMSFLLACLFACKACRSYRRHTGY